MAKIAVITAISAVGAFGALGCFIAALLEIDGFGRPRDIMEPRLGYLFLLALGFFTSTAVPAFLWRRFFPKMGIAWLIPIGVGVVGAGAILGISLMR